LIWSYKRSRSAHISGRYPEEEILAEAAMIFPDSRVAADFDRFVV
jgi:ribonuclease Z